MLAFPCKTSLSNTLPSLGVFAASVPILARHIYNMAFSANFLSAVAVMSSETLINNLTDRWEKIEPLKTAGTLRSYKNESKKICGTYYRFSRKTCWIFSMNFCLRTNSVTSNCEMTRLCYQVFVIQRPPNKNVWQCYLLCSQRLLLIQIDPLVYFSWKFNNSGCKKF